MGTKEFIQRIAKKAGVKEAGLRVTLSRIKKRHDLNSIEQAGVFYIKKNDLDINVSSIIDNVTRIVVQTVLGSQHAPAQTKPKPVKAKTKKVTAPKVKWVSQKHYNLASKIADFYPYLFIFENALRIKIDDLMTTNHGVDWWDTRLKADRPDIWNYADDEAKKQAKLPMIGKANLLQPIEYLTIGQLEQIIVKYQSLFIPSVFPTRAFFTGHMVIVKKVRNAVAHMTPSTTATDIRNAKNNIDILLQHLATVK